MDIKVKQPAVMEVLLLEGCVGEEIVIDLRNMSGSVACCRASGFRWIGGVRGGSEEPRNDGRPGTPHEQETDSAIRSILQEDTNASLRIIAETLSISRETVRLHMSRMRHTLKALRWIPHALSCEPKQVRLTMFL
jgi:hypothetical protein